MGLEDHGQWAIDTGKDPGPVKMTKALQALEGTDDHAVLLDWLRDPSWPSNRVARAVRRMGQAEAIPELANVNHNNVTSWRAANGVKMHHGT